MNHLQQILAFRAYDMRDRFPQPFNSFRDALEALQSDRAYLPEMSGDIICYLKNGQSIPIPDLFFLVTLPHFDSREAAETWVIERDKKIKNGSSISRAMGIALADTNLPINAQIDQAVDSTDIHLIDVSENDRVCKDVDVWLNAAISALPGVNGDI